MLVVEKYKETKGGGGRTREVLGNGLGSSGKKKSLGGVQRAKEIRKGVEESAHKQKQWRKDGTSKNIYSSKN